MEQNRYIILGANGFIGSEITKFLLKEKANVEAFTKDQLNLLNIVDFNNKDFTNSIIIDCISRINGSKEEIELTNNRGLENFVNFLKNNHTGFKYIYFSTISTLQQSLLDSNSYVKSKFNAEHFIKKNILDYKIIRLTFPFGLGESSTRLFSRLINKLKLEEELLIDNIKINITPINKLVEFLPVLIESKQNEINFTDGEVYSLHSVVEYLVEKIGSTSIIKVNEAVVLDISIKSYQKGISFKPDVYSILDKMVHAN